MKCSVSLEPGGSRMYEDIWRVRAENGSGVGPTDRTARRTHRRDTNGRVDVVGARIGSGL